MSKKSRISADATVAIAHDDLDSVDLGIEEIMLDKRRGHYYGLNESAAFILASLRTSVSVQEIVDAVAKKYDVESSRVEPDVVQFLNDLEARGLLRISRSPRV